MRALATIVMALMCVLGLATSSSGSTPVSTSSSSTHDIPTYDTSENYAAPAHGPPATANSHTATTHDAVERWSPRASAHQRDTVASRTYPYNHHVSHAQVAPALGATREHAQADGGGLSTTASVGVAANTVGVAAGEGLERAPGALVRNVGPHENMGALCDELCSLTYASGREHALVNTSSGFQIHAGGATGIDLSSDVTQVLAHTHPYHLPALGPSADDVAMLGQLGQSTSILPEHGQTILFGRGGTIAWR